MDLGCSPAGAFTSWRSRPLQPDRLSSAPCGRSTNSFIAWGLRRCSFKAKPPRSRQGSSAQPPFFDGRLPRHSADIRALQRSTPSNIRPRAVRKPGRPARPLLLMHDARRSNRPGSSHRRSAPARRRVRSSSSSPALGSHRRLRPRTLGTTAHGRAHLPEWQQLR